VAFILSQMNGFGVDDVRLGLGARAFGVTSDPEVEEPVESNFAINEVPEPTSLLLFGSAAAAFAMRRRLSARAH
jgi:hypothetical protein